MQSKVTMQAEEGHWDVALKQKQSKKSKGKGKKNLPRPYMLKRYYTKSDIQKHNKSNDCWVIIFDKVFDITRLLQFHFNDPLCDPLIKYAGKDISHWFNPSTKDPKTCIDRETGVTKYFTPEGRFLDVPDLLISDPRKQGNIKKKRRKHLPWWKRRKRYCVGTLTSKKRKIRLINMLTNHDDIINVPNEETLQEILVRYEEINVHAGSYTWKRLGRPLDMTKTLEDNDIADETDEFERMGIPEDQWYVPAIHLYFNDDLTIK